MKDLKIQTSEFSKITMESIWNKVERELSSSDSLFMNTEDLNRFAKNLIKRINDYEKAKKQICILEQRTALYKALFDLSPVPNIKYYAGDFASFLDPKFAKRVCYNPCLDKLWNAVVDTRMKWWTINNVTDEIKLLLKEYFEVEFQLDSVSKMILMEIYSAVYTYLKEKQQELSSFCNAVRNLITEKTCSAIQSEIKYVVLGIVFYLLLVALIDLPKQDYVVNEMVRAAIERMIELKTEKN